jgi:hypothetical protein
MQRDSLYSKSDILQQCSVCDIGREIPRVKIPGIMSSSGERAIELRAQSYQKKVNITLARPQSRSLRWRHVPTRFINPPISAANLPPGLSARQAFWTTAGGDLEHQWIAALLNTASKEPGRRLSFALLSSSQVIS